MGQQPLLATSFLWVELYWMDVITHLISPTLILPPLILPICVSLPKICVISLNRTTRLSSKVVFLCVKGCTMREWWNFNNVFGYNQRVLLPLCTGDLAKSLESRNASWIPRARRRKEVRPKLYSSSLFACEVRIAWQGLKECDGMNLYVLFNKKRPALAWQSCSLQQEEGAILVRSGTWRQTVELTDWWSSLNSQPLI